MLFFCMLFVHIDIIKDNKDITCDSGSFFIFCHFGFYHFFMIKISMESINENELLIIRITVVLLYTTKQ